MPNDDLAARIAALEARDAIRDLVARYCHYVRERRHDNIVGLYTPDGVFDMPAVMAEGGVRSGRDAIAETFARNNEAMDPWPFTHNHVIDLDGEDRATGHVYTEFRIGSDDMRVGFVGVYADEYVRHEGVWKFRRRKLQSVALPA
ncbi:nuclear transport factor 2 family protein [Rhizorhabdus dicambivorans]|uniref:Nuclear transport factor 2 family protein n=1 Tax=Rhizorhabdus dicambivorans TaxID=1850238 RepID=A0A2A4FW00_9SPHN|nr:nuclear transport factor 2 family protein [Rhizorhabdus dicambivorans]ATE65847.1 nuclear transport factor 2 family protein [Rhizorhabdus dicambivorans]PCE42961.1 nuclear transport factor 2 family protein [Rhizorhabdus dicambivorans]